jgi:hypothetical protein
MTKEIFHTLTTLASITTYCSLLVVLLKFRGLSPALRLVSYHIILASTTEVVLRLVRLMYKGNNLPVLHLYTPLECTIICWFYLELLDGFISKKWIHGFLYSFLIFSMVNSFWIQDIWTFNTNSRPVEAAAVILMAILFFYRILSEMKIKRLDKYPEFWINTGYLLYFSGAFFLFLPSNFIIDKGKLLNLTIWSVHAVLSVILYSLLGLSIWMYRKT